MIFSEKHLTNRFECGILLVLGMSLTKHRRTEMVDYEVAEQIRAVADKVNMKAVQTHKLGESFFDVHATCDALEGVAMIVEHGLYKRAYYELCDIIDDCAGFVPKEVLFYLKEKMEAVSNQG